VFVLDINGRTVTKADTRTDVSLSLRGAAKADVDRVGSDREKNFDNKGYRRKHDHKHKSDSDKPRCNTMLAHRQSLSTNSVLTQY